MARPKKSDLPDLARPHELTFGIIDRLACPIGKQQAFLRDTRAPSLRVRVTAAGVKAFVFEAKLNRQTIRRTIGDVRSWSIEQARQEANRLRVTLDSGVDPREQDRQQAAESAAHAAGLAAQKIMVREAWDDYLAQRKDSWGPRHYADHVHLARSGGPGSVRGTRGTGVTIAGPLHELLDIYLGALTDDLLAEWAKRHGAKRPAVARLAMRQFKAFLRWCAEQKAYKAAVAGVAAKFNSEARKSLGKAGVKQDALLREQLPAWFSAVQRLSNRAIAACLQTILLTGARPGEIIEMRWADMDLKWRGLTIRDKVEGDRLIPLTPYVHALLHALPRRGPWVFSSKPRGKAVGQESKPVGADPILTTSANRILTRG